MVSDVPNSQNKMLLCQKITGENSYFSKQVHLPLLASLKIKVFHPQPTLKLVLGLVQFAISKFLGFSLAFTYPSVM